ncbi:hypothetical protein CXB51_000962 [Gossypium anomalum]|uniref:Uncharacterized protein n=1 Tax=Gossypium anomalum TaxID=47600 RepID=A0A8J6DEV8_9ROSI|nr:hypothetical protein CXB51_000962 [Gossypium anomalum]
MKNRCVFVDRGDQKVLMEEDNFDHTVETQLVPDDDFMADLLVDLPPCSGGDVLRNIYAIVRSRERKKMYVKDLKMKSRYLEGECRELSCVLQCFIVENQAL